MHYNIVLLPKKITSYVTSLLFIENNVLRYIVSLGRACFFVFNANVKVLSQQSVTVDM